MKPTYRIKDWDAEFETAESRKLKNTRWVPIPTKHDGKGFRRITLHNESVAIFCAWNLIVQVASKMPVRGILADEDGPLDADDLAAKTGFPPAIFSIALEFLSSEQIGWIQTRTQRKAGDAARIRQSPSPEGKGIEGNGREQKGIDPPADADDGFPPFSGDSFLSVLSSFEQHRKEIKKPLKSTGRKLLYRQLEEMGEAEAIAAMEKSIAAGWQGVFEPSAHKAAPSKVEQSMAAARRVAAEYEH